MTLIDAFYKDKTGHIPQTAFTTYITFVNRLLANNIRAKYAACE